MQDEIERKLTQYQDRKRKRNTKKEKNIIPSYAILEKSKNVLIFQH